MRLFIAAELPHAIKEDIQSLMERFRPLVDHRAQLRWMGSAQFHLTLKFLGDCEPAKVPLLLETLRTLARSCSNFNVEFQGLGCFPTSGPPQILWLGLSQGDAETRLLAATLEERMVPLGFPKEKRPFNAHLTLGRIKRVHKAGELRSFLQRTATTPIGPVPIRQVSLVQSHLTAGGAHYEVLEAIHLDEAR